MGAMPYQHRPVKRLGGDGKASIVWLRGSMGVSSFRRYTGTESNLNPDRYGPERELYREAVSKGQRLKMNGECTAQTPGNPMIRHGGVGPPFLISFQ